MCNYYFVPYPLVFNKAEIEFTCQSSLCSNLIIRRISQISKKFNDSNRDPKIRKLSRHLLKNYIDMKISMLEYDF